MTTNPTRLAALTATALLAAATFAGCSSDTPSESDSSTPAAQHTSEVADGQILSITDPWVKANEKAKMTAAFGTLENPDDTDIHVTGGHTSVAGKLELHTVTDVDGKMQMVELEDGFTIPAGGTHLLEPGADHLMLMMMKEDLQPGAEVEITLDTDAGTFTFTAPVRTFAGANEEYGAHGEGMDGEMDEDMNHDDKDDGGN